MTPTDDDLLTALHSARPAPGYRPSPNSPEAAAMLARILDGPREPASPRRLVTRRRLVRTGLPALAAAVTATIVAVTLTPSGPARSQLSAGMVRTAVLDALQQNSGDILQISSTDQANGTEGPSSSSAWIYPAFPVVGQQVRFRHLSYLDGKPYLDVESIYTEDARMEQLTSSGTQVQPAEIVGVDYQNRTWAKYTSSAFPGNLAFSPSLIRSEIASGRFTVDGTVKLNGQDTVELSWTERIAPGPASSPVTLWVDAQTYVPLRETYVIAEPGAVTVKTTVTYQMRAAATANLEVLTPVIPTGFTRAQQVPGLVPIGS
jgi:hypothetical protein